MIRRTGGRPGGLLGWLIALPASALAHGGQPQVVDIAFMPQAPNVAWAITDNQGLFVSDGTATRWLCEDSIEPGESIRALGLLGAGRDHWVISTDLRLYTTADGGCTFEPTRGALAGQRSRAISVHPDDPTEALIATDTLGGALNDVYRTVDGGDRWLPAGLDLPGQITEMHRAPADPARIYLVHERGGERSDDAGRTFGRIKLGPPALDAAPHEFKLLGSSPTDPDVLFAAIERFDTLVVRSVDGGGEWEVVLEVPDFPLTLVMAADGQRAIIHSPFEGLFRSADGGMTWRPEAPPVDRLGCLRRAPGGDRLWGCTNVFFGGPWALGTSDDFGATWRPHLEAFEDVARWGCPARTLGRDCCQHLCPGLPPGGVCEGAAAAPGPTCGGPAPTDDLGVAPLDMDPIDAGPDAVVADAGVDAAIDQAVDRGAVTADRGPDRAAPDAPPDARPDRAPDALMAEPAPPAAAPDDCTTRPGPGRGGAPVLLFLLWFRARTARWGVRATR